jgi:hypothetical protein
VGAWNRPLCAAGFLIGARGNRASALWLAVDDEPGACPRLGQPARSFGIRGAKDFVQATMGGSGESNDAGNDSSFGEDLVDAALDTSFFNFETIEVYETSFKPL